MSKSEQLTKILLSLYDEHFLHVFYEQYELSWADLRTLAGGSIDEITLTGVSELLNRKGFVLVGLDDSVLVANQSDLSARKVPGRLIQKYLNNLEKENMDSDDNYDEYDED